MDIDEEEDENEIKDQLDYQKRQIILNSAKKQLNNPQTGDDIAIDPILIIKNAFKKVEGVGSSTVLVGVLNKNQIHIANLGDSRF